MIPTASELTDYLSTSQWEVAFDGGVCQRGRKYMRDGRVGDVGVEVLPTEEVALSAEVFGSAAFAYEVEVLIYHGAGGLEVDAACNCDYAHFCKHAVAVLARVGKAGWLEQLPKLMGSKEAVAGTGEDFDKWLETLQVEEEPAAPRRVVGYVLQIDGQGGLAVELKTSAVKADGSLTGAPSVPRLEEGPGEAFTKEDRVILTRLRGYAAGKGARWQVAGEAFDEVLTMILKTGRCYWEQMSGQPMTAGAGREGLCDWQVDDGGDTMSPAIVVEPRADVVLLLDSAWYVAVASREVGAVKLAVYIDHARRWLAGPKIAADEAVEAAGKLEQLSLPQAFARPAVLNVEHLNERPVPCLLVGRRTLATPGLAQAFGYGDPTLVADLFFKYGKHRIKAVTAGTNAVERRGEGNNVVLLHRDLKAEGRYLQQMENYGLMNLLLVGQSGTADFDFSQNLAPEDLGVWFPAAEHLTPEQFWTTFRERRGDALREEGWEVTFEDSGIAAPLVVEGGQLELELDEAGGGWFDVSAGFEVGGRSYDLVPILSDLLAAGAMERGSRVLESESFLYYPEGRAEVLRLPSERLRSILRLVRGMLEEFDFSKGPRIPLVEAAELAAGSDLVRAPKRLLELGQRLKMKTPQEAGPVPSGLQATLRSYQEEGFRWMQFLARHDLNGILADDMGLGKTLQTLAHILAEKENGRSGGRPSLVIAPTSVVVNWKKEAGKFAPILNVLVLQGSSRKKLYAHVADADIVVTSFALLHRDIERLKKTEFHLAILDEAQHIKNYKAKVSEAACELQARHRICLSGTPIENHLGELWSLMNFLMPGLLGEHADFTADYRTPIEREGDEEKRAKLVKQVGPLILRRTKDEVAKDLPPKTELLHHIELTTKQKDLYETVRVMMNKQVRDAIAAQGAESSQILFLDALMKLRQICCHPKLLQKSEAQKIDESAKLDYLLEMLDTLFAEGRRVLLFSQFTSMLEKIEHELELRKATYLKLTGESKNRQDLVDRFQGGEGQIFLISLKAGGTGLTLTAADTVIHYDPWWNPAAEAQATDRAYRIGQDKPVFVHKLICEGTVEQRIQEMQAKKAELADALLGGAAKSLKLTEDVVKDLLSPVE